MTKPLRESIREVLIDNYPSIKTNSDTDSKVIEAILSLFLEVVPKEKYEPQGKTYPSGLKIGYNTCIKDIKDKINLEVNTN